MNQEAIKEKIGNKRTFFQTFSILALTLMMVFSITVAAQADEPTTSVDVQPPMKELTADESYTVSLAAGRILKHANQALQALEDGDQNIALDHVEKGLQLVRIVEKIMPAVTVKTEIKSGNLVYHDEDKIGPTLVPIYDELDHSNELALVTNPFKEGSKKKNAKVAAYDYSGLTYSAVKLDIPLAKRNFDRSKKFIAKNEMDKAEAVLQEIPDDGLVFTYESIDLPLERAADNLKLAEDAMTEGDVAQAKADLLISLDALKEYESLTGQNRSKEVQELRDEISQTAEQVLSAKDTEKSAGRIEGWWNHAVQWFRD